MYSLVILKTIFTSLCVFLIISLDLVVASVVMARSDVGAEDGAQELMQKDHLVGCLKV